MSTLNEIAMNHARMAKEKAGKSTELSERHLQIVGSFEVPPYFTHPGISSFKHSEVTANWMPGSANNTQLLVD